MRVGGVGTDASLAREPLVREIFVSRTRFLPSFV